MSNDYQITQDGEIILITLGENVTFNTVCEIWDGMMSEYDCSKRLWDLTHFKVMPTQEQLVEFAYYANKTAQPHSYSAMVAPTDILFGVMRQHQVYRERDENTTVRVFRTVEEARSWLTSL